MGDASQTRRVARSAVAWLDAALLGGSVAAGAEVLAVVELSILFGPAPIRVVAGVTLGLILPGLVITRILAPERLEGAEQLLLVPAISMVIAILTGLVLNAAHLHLTTDNWAIALGLVTATGLAIVAKLERHEQVGKHPHRDSAAPLGAASDTGWRIRGVVAPALLAVAALAAIGALVIGARGQHYRGQGFTQLWALPGRGALSAVRLGVLSHELHEARYRIRVSVDGQEVGTQEITLRPGQAWQSTQPVTNAGEVEVRLERRPGGAVYRHVRLRVGRGGG